MGNKVSIKPKFEAFVSTKNPGDLQAALQELMAQKISDEDVKNVILPDIIRKFITDNFEGFKITITECINHILFVAGSEKVLIETEVTALNNALTLLIRFLPVLHEENFKSISQQLLWTKTTFPPQKATEIKQGPYVMEECLAIKLMYSLFRLLFHPEYTVSSRKAREPQNLKVGGLTSDMRFYWKTFDNFRSENDQYKFYYNRTKVLECLLACFSASILSPLNPTQRSGDPWIHYCISPHNPMFLTALISMLNFGLSYEENGKVPYSQYITGKPAGEKLAVLSLQIFALFSDVKIDDSVLYHKVLESPEYQQVVEHYLKFKEQKLFVESFEINNTHTCKEILQNASHIFLKELKLTELYEFISKNVLRVLKNPFEVENTYLIESRKKTMLLEEILLVFWRVIEYNNTYLQRAYYLSSFLQIVVYLIYQIHESITYATKSSIFYISVIILSKLSCDRSFPIQLKRKYINDIGFTRIPVFIGTHIDLLFVVLLNGMVDSYVKGYFCYQNNLLAILHNIAPFAKDLSSTTASLLIQLVKAVASPKVLQRDKNNLLVLRKALNLVHKIICFQPETSINVLYELLSQNQELEYLKKLPLKKIYGFVKSPQSVITGQKSQEQNASKTVDVSASQPKGEKGEEEEETKVSPDVSSIKKPGQPKGNPITSASQIQQFDEKWMELYKANVANDLIFVVIEYLQEQLRNTYREKNTNEEESVKTFLQEQSILGIAPQPGPIMVEVANDPDNINNNLFVSLWYQIYVKCNDMPHFEAKDVKLLTSS